MRQATRWPLAARLAGAALLFLAVTAAQAGASADNPREWIVRMNQALATLNYDGVFTQQFGDRSEVMRIVHRVHDGKMTERVISTDGSGYEQKRSGSAWAQFRPDKKRVEYATRNRSFGYFPALNGLDDLAARHYAISDAGRARLLGRDVQVIHVEPRDALRYGYRFWLDRQNGLPLKFQRIAHDGQVLKEIAFISPPALPETISDDQLKVAVDVTDFQRVNRDGFTPMHNPGLKRAYTPQAALLPAGYRTRIFNSAAQEARAAGPRARFIVSDGVSWAEVFVAPATDEARTGNFGAGPLAGYQLRLDGVLVTVVGEMPQAAAQAIAQAVRPE